MSRAGAALAWPAWLAWLAWLALAAHASGAAAAPPAATAPCVQVQAGTQVAGQLHCLNQALRTAAAGARTGGVPPLAAAATALDPLQRGQPTPAALRQRYGSTYGHSLPPQRPRPDYLPAPFAPAR
ncbi:hypothetical protein [Xanthomonas theicola]|uniref:Uncharacterized protein n=1 Tax=Xanthomonas theicola TaxID=56464 RepID=A0A2S6ZD01_9XANT|nr:hypothetical protein [Xanthomonas theicola]PPT89182.1 hypothetical protein XthCFBP4691_13965 [Xanthomonas theicola]QNH25866.1 hypothetical protein G4Q83_15400 [Xanthomonas theicola]